MPVIIAINTLEKETASKPQSKHWEKYMCARDYNRTEADWRQKPVV